MNLNEPNETKIFVMGRGTGKTGMLIKQSSETGYPILCKDETACKFVKHQAEKMHLNIPQPINATLFSESYHLTHIVDGISRYEGVIVDDVIHVLNCMVGRHIHSMTIEKEMLADNMAEKETSNIEFKDIINLLKRDILIIENKLHNNITNTIDKENIKEINLLINSLQSTIKLIKEYEKFET